MKTSLLKYTLLAGVALSILPAPAQADDGSTGPWQFRLRGIGVLPDSGGHTDIGGKPEADNAFVPEFDISYFFTKNIAAELILATSPHDLKLKDSSLGDVDLGSTWVLPPVLTLQYHFQPDQAFSPYVGAGINYMIFYGGEDENGFKVDIDDGFGYALQAGVDVALQGPWSANLDVKKVFFETDASINGGALKSKVKLDPWVVSAGFGYKF